MARGVIDLTSKTLEAQREKDVAELSEIINILFVKSKPKDNNDIIRKFIDRAITLKKQLTEEQAVYRCYFHDCGQSVADLWVDIGEDHSQPVPVLLCMFPGLARHVLSDDRRLERVPVVRAFAEAELPSN
jgi:hypothetical protein